MILDSGISAGAVVVIVLNLLLNRQDGGHLAPAQTDTEPPEKLGPTGDSESYEVVLNNSERAAAWAERKAAEARVAVAEARDAQVRAAQIRAAEGSR
jgi:NCS2 family nucleobase:cation symporter-2